MKNVLSGILTFSELNNKEKINIKTQIQNSKIRK